MVHSYTCMFLKSIVAEIVHIPWIALHNVHIALYHCALITASLNRVQSKNYAHPHLRNCCFYGISLLKWASIYIFYSSLTREIDWCIARSLIVIVKILVLPTASTYYTHKTVLIVQNIPIHLRGSETFLGDFDHLLESHDMRVVVVTVHCECLVGQVHQILYR